MSVSTSEQNSEISFRELNLSGPLLEALERAGYSTATPIQARAIPPLLEGRDVLGQAQTGTGKTAAFAVPMLQAIDVEKQVTQVVVLTPTRELAIQVAAAFKRYAVGLSGVRVAAIYGGQDYQVQFRQLDRGAHIVVGTPGRVIDHIRRGSLKLNDVRGLVLDEADEMLRMGFAEEVDWILNQTPSERQTALFSATLPDSIRRIAQRHLRNPAEITIKQRSATADTVRQRFVVVGPHEKQDVLARVLEAESIDGVLIFVNTKSTTEPLAEFLSSRGHRTAALSSDVAQSQRERIVQHLRSGKVDVIIATDVAARGLDVQRISHVINYDFPTDSESYVHRIGRTGRAGRTGNAILFLHPRGRHLLRRIEQATRQTIEPMEIPGNEAINERRVVRFHERITTGLAHRDIATFASLVEQYRKENDVPLEQIAAALAALAAGDTPLLLTAADQPAGSADFGDRRDHGQRPTRDRSFGRERRDENTGRSGRRNGEGRNSEQMETFRIEVGHAHKVKPTNIVGAIANESGLESRFIGRIEIFDEHSTVDMLAGMPPKVFETLKQVKIGGRRLNISRLADGSVANDWPVVGAAKPVGKAPAPALPSTPEPEDRPAVKMTESTAPAPTHRPAGKKFKVKLKPKFAAAKKAKGTRSAHKRLLPTR
jgi:ATP-dependent RNA helicase DeaD